MYTRKRKILYWCVLLCAAAATQSFIVGNIYTLHSAHRCTKATVCDRNEMSLSKKQKRNCRKSGDTFCSRKINKFQVTCFFRGILINGKRCRKKDEQRQRKLKCTRTTATKESRSLSHSAVGKNYFPAFKFGTMMMVAANT